MLYYDHLCRVPKHFTLPPAPPPPDKPHAHQAVAPHSLSMDLPVLDIFTGRILQYTTFCF